MNVPHRQTYALSLYLDDFYFDAVAPRNNVRGVPHATFATAERTDMHQPVSATHDTLQRDKSTKVLDARHSSIVHLVHDRLCVWLLTQGRRSTCITICAVTFNFFMKTFSLLGLLFVVVRLRPCLVLDGQAGKHLCLLLRCAVL